MSNELNRIYSFLAGFGRENAWIHAADQNGDDAITINEFRSLIDSEWDTDSLGNVPDNDLINNFFRKFDDNKSGANKDRIRTENGSISNLYAWSKAEYNDEEMQANVEKFVNINEVMRQSSEIINQLANNIFGPDRYGEAYSEWYTVIKSEVMNRLANCETGDITTNKVEEILNSSDMTKIHAKYCAKAYIEKLSKDITYKSLVEHGYDITKDNDLNNLVNELVTTQTIYSNIRVGIDRYLNGKEKDNRTETSPITQGQKDLAGAQLRKKLLEELAKESDFAQYKNAYTSCVAEYVDSVKVPATKMSDITNKTVTDFKESNFYKIDLEEKIALQEQINAAREAISENLESLFEEDVFGEATESIKKLVNKIGIENIITDEIIIRAVKEFDIDFTTEEGINLFIYACIAANIDKLFPNGYNGIEDANVEKIHEERMAIIDSEIPLSNFVADTNRTTEDIKLELAQNAAIDYCEWLAKKSDEHKAAVEEVLGTSDIKTAFKNLTSCEAIKALLDNIINGLNGNASLFNNIINDNYNLNISGYTSINLPTSVVYKGENVNKERISYDVNGNGVKLSSYSTSKIVINPTESGIFTCSVKMKIDGKVVATKEFTVTVNGSLSGSECANQITTWKGTAPDGVTVLYKNGNNTGDSISKKDFYELYNSNSIICLGFWQDDTKADYDRQGKAYMEERLTKLGNYIVDTITNVIEGLDKDLLTQAVKNVVTAYTTTGYTYIECNSGHTPEEAYKSIDGKDDTSGKLYNVTDTTGNNSHCYCITFKDFVDAIITEYNNLLNA